MFISMHIVFRNTTRVQSSNYMSVSFVCIFVQSSIKEVVLYELVIQSHIYILLKEFALP